MPDAQELGARTRPVRWLLLDVGGVLEIVDDDAWPSRFHARWAARFGLSESQLRRRLEAADLPDTTTRAGVEDDFWAAYGAALGAPAPVVAELRADFWDEYCGVANDELFAALRRLHGTVALAILSNSGDGAREEEERRFGFASLFDLVCYSHETGFAKPDPRAFETALRHMDAEPAEVLFVDDRVQNVEVARDLGLRAHLHVDNAGTLAAIAAALDGDVATEREALG
jgi:putative hydrolase of the HAD superfamily